MTFFTTFFDETRTRLNDASPESLDRLCAVLHDARARGTKAFVAGNGGSAAIASHIVVDLTKAASLRAVTFSDHSAVTCYANDYGYEQALAKAVESWGDSGDVAIFI